MSIDIDFSALSLRDTLDLAILVEEEAQERYRDFAEQMRVHHTPDAADFFDRMVVIEGKHAEMLGTRRQALFGDEPRTVKLTQIYQVEAPEFEKLRAFTSVPQALEIALESEVKAEQFYAGARPVVEDADVAKLFAELEQQEVRHQEMIRAMMAKRPGDDGFDPDDFVDEPVGH